MENTTICDMTQTQQQIQRGLKTLIYRIVTIESSVKSRDFKIENTITCKFSLKKSLSGVRRASF